MSDHKAELKRKYREKLSTYYKTLCQEYQDNPDMFSTEEVTPEVENIRNIIESCRRASPGATQDSVKSVSQPGA